MVASFGDALRSAAIAAAAMYPTVALASQIDIDDAGFTGRTFCG
jgi:hypothetical protein